MSLFAVVLSVFERLLTHVRTLFCKAGIMRFFPASARLSSSACPAFSFAKISLREIFRFFYAVGKCVCFAVSKNKNIAFILRARKFIAFVQGLARDGHFILHRLHDLLKTCVTLQVKASLWRGGWRLLWAFDRHNEVLPARVCLWQTCRKNFCRLPETQDKFLHVCSANVCGWKSCFIV